MQSYPIESQYIPPQPYSVDGLLEIISALENTHSQEFAQKFEGSQLFATQRKGEVIINEKLMQELEMSAESAHKKGLLSIDEYSEITQRIKKLREKYA